MSCVYLALGAEGRWACQPGDSQLLSGQQSKWSGQSAASLVFVWQCQPLESVQSCCLKQTALCCAAYWVADTSLLFAGCRRLDHSQKSCSHSVTTVQNHGVAQAPWYLVVRKNGIAFASRGPCLPSSQYTEKTAPNVCPCSSPLHRMWHLQPQEHMRLLIDSLSSFL